VHWGALATTFGLIFLAELPDKTAWTVLLLAARNRPLPVLLGAWTAFLAQGMVALALGTLLAKLPPQAVRWTAAAVFLGFGLLLLLREEGPEEEESLSHRKAFASAFTMVFLAEMGDATQIGTAALVARFAGARASVFVGATLALWSVSALAITVGRTLGPRINKRLLRKFAGLSFIAFAVASVLFGQHTG
jgi:putative Ca2+/H+ antiporter (TMEM165/GDT1 family)